MKLATYNLKNGGFTEYDYSEKEPPRLPLIIKAVKSLDADCVCLIDTYRWKQLYRDEEVSKMFGYKYVRQCFLDDDSVEPDICLAFLSRLPIIDGAAVKLATRNALVCTIYYAGQPIDIYTTYLYHADEDIRLKQVNALLRYMESRKTTKRVVAGDLNTFADYDSDGNMAGLKVFKKHHPQLYEQFGAWVEDMRRAEVIKLLEYNGIVGEKTTFQASLTTPLLHPSIPKDSHWFRVDYILASAPLQISNTRVRYGDIFEKASDHFPVVADID